MYLKDVLNRRSQTSSKKRNLLRQSSLVAIKKLCHMRQEDLLNIRRKVVMAGFILPLVKVSNNIVTVEVLPASTSLLDSTVGTST